eukprot:7283637-Pyramimonas_sp.AAC.1
MVEARLPSCSRAGSLQAAAMALPPNEVAEMALRQCCLRALVRLRKCRRSWRNLLFADLADEFKSPSVRC